MKILPSQQKNNANIALSGTACGECGKCADCSTLTKGVCAAFFGYLCRPNSAGFLLSLLLHVALFLALFNGAKTLNINEVGEHVMAINLMSFSESPQKKIEKKHEKKRIKKHEKIPAPAQVEEASTTPSASEIVSENQNEIQMLSYKDGVHNETFLKIKQAIERHNKYPPMARRSGLEGEVLVEFVLDASGKPSNIAVLKNARHKAFDKAAVNAIKSAQNDFPTMNKKTKIEILIAYKMI